MSSVIGVFDDDQTLRRGMRRLQAAGVSLDAVTVLDSHAPSPQTSSEAQSPGAGDAVLPGAAPAVGHAGVAVASRGGAEPPEVEAVLRGRVPSEASLEFYRRTLAHDGRIIVIDVDPEACESVSATLQASGATRVERHD